MEAEERSGRSDLEIFSESHSVSVCCGTSRSVMGGVVEEEDAWAFSKAVGRMESTFRGASLDLTLASAFPAYMDRTNVSSVQTWTTSVTGDTSRAALRRGMALDPNFVLAARMCV